MPGPLRIGTAAAVRGSSVSRPHRGSLYGPLLRGAATVLQRLQAALARAADKQIGHAVAAYGA